MNAPRHSAFKTRLRNFDPLLGTFLRTPSIHVCEILARAPLDVICVDAEHAPFGPAEIDACVLALRANDMPSLVRVPSFTPTTVLQALDCGSAGIVVPHVTSATQAENISKAAHFGPGGRGYAGSTRAGNYSGNSMTENLHEARATTAVIAQIEDLEALEALDAIAAVEGIDCLFVGRMDLTVALGADGPDDPRVVDAVKRICQVGRKHGRAVGMFVPRVEDSTMWMKEGASFFLLASDQALMLSGARSLAESFAAARARL
jgi:2-keto-3-deoxy-L-rhamnonate aldolase RhmA